MLVKALKTVYVKLTGETSPLDKFTNLGVFFQPFKNLYRPVAGLKITGKNYLSVGNVTKIFTFPPQFQPF